jgi:hypothetical protein
MNEARKAVYWAICNFSTSMRSLARGTNTILSGSRLPHPVCLSAFSFPPTLLPCFQIRDSDWGKNDGLAVVDVPHAPYKTVLLTVRRYPVESQTGQYQHFICLESIDDTGIR